MHFVLFQLMSVVLVQVNSDNSYDCPQSDIIQVLIGRIIALENAESNRYAELERKFDELIKSVEQERDATEEFISQLQANTDSMKSEVNFTSKNCTMAAPAFTVRLRENFISPSTNAKVIFTDVVANVRDSYNVQDGLFNVTIPGMYHFSLTVRNSGSGNAHGSLMKNGQLVGTAIAIDRDGNWSGTGSVSVTLHMRSGDIVHVESIFSGETLEAVNSIFTGFLLYPC